VTRWGARFLERVTIIDSAVAEAAARLAAAASRRTPCAPVRDLIGADDVAVAYRVQELLVADRIAAGARRLGWKIGLTSPAVQAQLGVDQPDFGALLDDMVVAQDEPVSPRRLLQPRIEGELAFVLARDLDTADPTPDEVRESIAAVRPALEIVDSRIAGWDITLADTVADNASSGLFVLGDAAVAPSDVDTVAVELELRRDGEVVSTGSGAACLGDPILAVTWLARTAYGFGTPLRAGDVVLSGALGPMVPVRPGETYTARMSGVGDVRVAFAEKSEVAA
jgi:2-keto-4-pentenoate hydratase